MLKNELCLVRNLHPSCPRALATKLDGGLPHKHHSSLTLCSRTSSARDAFRFSLHSTLIVGVPTEGPQYRTARGPNLRLFNNIAQEQVLHGPHLSPPCTIDVGGHGETSTRLYRAPFLFNIMLKNELCAGRI